MPVVLLWGGHSTIFAVHLNMPCKLLLPLAVGAIHDSESNVKGDAPNGSGGEWKELLT